MRLSESGERRGQGQEARGTGVMEGLSHSQNHRADLGTRRGMGEVSPALSSSFPTSTTASLTKLTGKLEGREPVDAILTGGPPEAESRAENGRECIWMGVSPALSHMLLLTRSSGPPDS